MKKLLAIVFSWRNTVHFLYEHILCYIIYIFTNEILSSIFYILSYLNYYTVLLLHLHPTHSLLPRLPLTLLRTVVPSLELLLELLPLPSPQQPALR